MYLQKIREHPSYVSLFLLIVYIVGIIGLNSNLRLIFQQLTPFNLLLTSTLLLTFHADWNKRFLIFIAVVLSGGWFIEWLGVKTGAIFGHYQYLDTLGWKFMGVPIIIGVNWLILIYCIGIILEKIKTSLIIKILLGATMMVAIDLFIEPVAIALDFWIWDADEVPVKNYVGWFFVSVFFFILFFNLKFEKKNKLGLPVYIIQMIFFIAMSITIWRF